MRQPLRPKPKLNFNRSAHQRKTGLRTSPFLWILIGCIFLLLILTGGVAWWLLTYQPDTHERNITPDKTIKIQITEPTGITPELPTQTPTMIPLPSSTPIPLICRTMWEIWAYSAPQEISTREKILSGRDVMVFTRIEEGGIQWYQVSLNGILRFIKVDDLICP